VSGTICYLCLGSLIPAVSAGQVNCFAAATLFVARPGGFRDNLRFADLHDKRAKALLARLGGVREIDFLDSSACSYASRRCSCSVQNQTSICCFRPASGLEQKIEFVFPASLETIRRGPRELTLRRPVGNWRDLAGGSAESSCCGSLATVLQAATGAWFSAPTKSRWPRSTASK
jgi:hypothetical protein